MALFESYERRIDQINAVLNSYGISSLEEAEKSSINNVPVDLIQIDLMDAFTKLGEIIGITYSEEVINNLFKNFCVGK